MTSIEDSSAAGAGTAHRAATRGRPFSESSTPRMVRLPDGFNVTDALIDLARRDPQRAVYAVRNGSGGWIDVTASAFLAEVRRVARGLIGLGIQPGQRIAVMAPTSYAWAVTDQAVWFAGAVSVPIYETSSVQQAVHVLRDSGSVLALAGGQRLLDVLAMAAGRAGGTPVHAMGTSAELEAIAEHGRDVGAEELERARSAASPGDLATLVYTSGTTGPPRGVRITHRNLAEGAANTAEFASEILGGEDSRTVLFLPLAHILGRIVQVVCLHRGVQVAHSATPGAALQDLRSFRPTWLIGVPRFFEKAYHEISVAAHAQGQGRMFEAARATAVGYSQAKQAQVDGLGPGPSMGLRMRQRIFRRLVYAAIQERFGGSVRYMISGASPLSTEITHFFHGAGLPIQEGYGLTESTAPITLNVPGATRIGTVGRPIPGAAVRVAEDGEILLAGDVVADGYHLPRRGQSDADARAGGNGADQRQSPLSAVKPELEPPGPGTEDEFFPTGDVGVLDADGFLTVTGRKQEIIVTASGHRVWPTPLEERVRENPLVAQCVVVGEARPFVAALLTLDADAVADWGRSRGLGVMSLVDAAKDQRLREDLRASIDRANATVSPGAAIRDFTVLDIEFGGHSGYMTPSMKLRRQLVISDFEEIIAGMYVG